MKWLFTIFSTQILVSTIMIQCVGLMSLFVLGGSLVYESYFFGFPLACFHSRFDARKWGKQGEPIPTSLYFFADGDPNGCFRPTGIFIWEKQNWDKEYKPVVLPFQVISLRLPSRVPFSIQGGLKFVIPTKESWDGYFHFYAEDSFKKGEWSYVSQTTALIINIFYVLLVLGCLLYIKYSGTLTTHSGRWKFLFIFSEIYILIWVIYLISCVVWPMGYHQWLFELLYVINNLAVLMIFFCMFDGVCRLGSKIIRKVSMSNLLKQH